MLAKTDNWLTYVCKNTNSANEKMLMPCGGRKWILTSCSSSPYRYSMGYQHNISFDMDFIVDTINRLK